MSEVKAVRPIKVIAAEIEKEWGAKVNYAAKPYLDAMFSLNSINDSYFADSGASVVSYFLANANSFKGEKAKAIKVELKSLTSTWTARGSARSSRVLHKPVVYPSRIDS